MQSVTEVYMQPPNAGAENEATEAVSERVHAGIQTPIDDREDVE